MSIINNMPSKGGMTLEALIEEYYVYAGENINAGKFVEFINGYSGEFTTGTSSWTGIDTTSGSATGLSAAELPSGNILIVHSNNATDYKLCAMVCTINGANIVPGVNVELVSSTNTGQHTAIGVIDDTRVVILYNSDASNYYLYGMVCTIEGTQINVGTGVQLSSESYSAQYAKIIVMETTKLFITYSKSDINGLMGLTCYVNGNTLSVQQSVEIWYNTNAAKYSTVNQLTDSTFLVTHAINNSDGNYLVGHICTVDNFTIKVSNSVTIDTEDSAFGHYCAKLNSTKAVVVYNEDTYREPMYGRVLTINGTTFTVGSQVTLDSSENGVGYYISGVPLSETQVLLFYTDEVSWGTEYSVCASLITVNGTSITPHTKVSLDTADAKLSPITLLLNNKNVFCTCSDGTAIYGQLLSIDYSSNLPTTTVKTYVIEKQVKIATTDVCNGLAKTGGKGGEISHKDKIQVYVPGATE